MRKNNSYFNLNNASSYIGTYYPSVDSTFERINTAFSQLFLENARKISLINFIKEAWPIINKGKEFIDHKVIHVIAEHLEAVSTGLIKRLCVSIPPRHSKSNLCSVFWPAWEWTFKPFTQWLTISYAMKLSIRDTLASRRLIESKWYQKQWGKIFQLTDDQNTKGRYDNNLNGNRIALSMLGSATGENADRIVIDDPHNVQEAESQTIIESTVEAFDKAISNRINNQKTGGIVIVAQRVGENDVIGHALASNEYEHLIIPSEYKSTTKSKTSLNFVDWRKKEGELLWPERFDYDFLAKEKRRLGAYSYAAQHDQMPVPAGGALFKEKDFQYITLDNSQKISYRRKHRHWDLAATVTSTADYTAGVLLGETYDDRYIILDVVREKVTPGEAEKLILNTAINDGYDVSVTIEEEKGADGKHTTSHYKRNILKGFDCREQALWADKVSRARGFVGYVEGKKVYLVVADWNHTYIAEITRFPKTTHKDQVDATSGAFHEFLKINPSNTLAWQNVQTSNNNLTNYTPVNI